MPEYQPQWTLPETFADATQDGTDSTDSFPLNPETVSTVSAAFGQNREIPLPESPVFKGENPAAAALVPQLEAGWHWLASHPDHPEHEPFFARWLARLREYRIDRLRGDVHRPAGVKESDQHGHASR